MNLHVDLVTLTLNCDTDWHTFKSLMGQSGQRNQDADSKRLELMLMHELAHLLSFLGSPISDLHRLIVTAQVSLLKQLLCDCLIKGPENNLYVPLFDTTGNLEPNTSGRGVEARSLREQWQLLDQLRLFYMGYKPRATVSGLLTAQQALYELHKAFAVDHNVFISETLFDWVKDDVSLAGVSKIEELPILPSWDKSSEKAISSTTISSISVIEGLAVLGEIMHARRRSENALGIRFSVPFPHSIGLRYALECINKNCGTNYQYEDLLGNRIPPEVIATLAGMFDLAMQVPLVEITSRLRGEAPSAEAQEKEEPFLSPTAMPGDDSKFVVKYSMAEMCPGWRLYLIGKMFCARKMPLLETASFEETRDFRDFQMMLFEYFDWPQMDMFGILAVMPFVEKYKSSSALQGHQVFDYLKRLARICRDRNEIAYIQQQFALRGDEWLDFVALRFPGGHLRVTGEEEACFDFVYRWDRDYYRLSSCVLGGYWDKWWTDYNEEEYAEVTTWIRDVLGAVTKAYARETNDPAYLLVWSYINQLKIEVRDEYNLGWRR